MAEVQRRLRSGAVVLGGMGALAAMLTACSSDADRRCVDRNSYQYDRGYRILSSSACSGSSSRGAWYYKSREEEKGWAKGGSFTKPRKGSGVHRGGIGGSGGYYGG
ncbi:hypothetical protein [Streptomyces sp. TP-A0874]|uniref:hypothetical protein n=1 Tax=Streptomyces sp. TP-A0874 TaxID=549819 RepID=UPI000852E475|nr:hypothetical protein [Streptomyces sp. TP-A0874]